MSIDIAISLLISLLTKSTEISALIAKVQSEGRTELSADEWKAILDADDAARRALIEAIASKKP